MHTRCAQVAAQNLECDLDIVRVKPTNTEVSPNSAPTGGTISTHAQMLLINKVKGLLFSFSFNFKQLKLLSIKNYMSFNQNACVNCSLHISVQFHYVLDPIIGYRGVKHIRTQVIRTNF